ncbi:ComEA family DNA-binding protein [Vibrio maerlii]|uniref:ComEA family DNA-binding protein n=1 Tax=Vibrio maerlii TaxID=2231648 RepID=UPI001F146B18|nr:ComEA family DNA-binding protein [Vibrio maerlii]
MDEEKVTKPDHYEGIEITVNINRADADELATLLKGIGQAKAKEIVAYRETHGAFKSADDLSKVKGIGAATVDKNRERILLN